jgi:hypothetical protein
MRSIERAAGYIVFLLSAIYYILNRYSGPAFIDSGELALASYTLGIPHPTGYPLYIILTRPATLFFDRPIEAVTVFSAVIGALAVFIFYHLFILISRDLLSDCRNRVVCGVLAAMIFAIAPIVAAQGTTNEVYGLSLLINLIIVYLVNWYLHSSHFNNNFRQLTLVFYMVGLTLTNHLQGIMFLPLLLLLLFWHFRREFSFGQIFILAGALIIPLILYGILAIRAAVSPPPLANWGDLTAWDNFYRHVTGWQYNIWMFSSNLPELWINCKDLVRKFIDQFPTIFWLLLPIGLFLTLKFHRRLFLCFVILAGVNLIIGINYSIPDNEGYFLLAIALLALIAFLGLIFIVKYLNHPWLLTAILGLLLIWQGYRVVGENYKGDYTLPEDFAVNMGRSAVYEAVVMSNIWDHHGQLYYLQQAEYFRPDLRLIDMELLRRSWYFKLIENSYPDLYRRIDSLVPPFLAELEYFEGSQIFDAAKLECYFQKIINILLTSGYPAYIDYGLNYTPERDHFFQIQGLMMRVETVRSDQPLPQPKLKWNGRKLGDYSDWRAKKHIHIIRYFGHI